jgi:hypothetical protein
LVVSRPSCSLAAAEKAFSDFSASFSGLTALSAAESAFLVVSRPSCSLIAAEKTFSDFSASLSGLTAAFRG